jgi:glycerol-3-phosphate dehydrogenase (NAD(P)+)
MAAVSEAEVSAPGKSLFAVLGAGSWGTALSMQLIRSGARALLWDWDTRHLEAIRSAGRNEQFMPEFPLPDGLQYESDLRAAVRRADEVLVVVPSQVREAPGHARASNPGQGSSCMSPRASCSAIRARWRW